jgi:hypothetical protein
MEQSCSLNWGLSQSSDTLVEQRHMKRRRELLDAYAAPSSRPGLSVLPNQKHLARAGEMPAYTTTYLAHLNQRPNR